MTVSVAGRQQAVLATFDRVESIKAIAATVAEDAASELRGIATELVNGVWHRLQDQALLDSPELQAGLTAWQTGNVTDA